MNVIQPSTNMNLWVNHEQTVDKKTSKVLRFVNLEENITDDKLQNYIKQRVRLTGEIKQIFIRKCEIVNLVFAYVIFELRNDALQTVSMWNIFRSFDGRVVNVELVDPDSKCTSYRIYSTASTLKQNVHHTPSKLYPLNRGLENWNSLNFIQPEKREVHPTTSTLKQKVQDPSSNIFNPQNIKKPIPRGLENWMSPNFKQPEKPELHPTTLTLKQKVQTSSSKVFNPQNNKEPIPRRLKNWKTSNFVQPEKQTFKVKAFPKPIRDLNRQMGNVSVKNVQCKESSTSVPSQSAKSKEHNIPRFVKITDKEPPTFLNQIRVCNQSRRKDRSGDALSKSSSKMNKGAYHGQSENPVGSNLSQLEKCEIAAKASSNPTSMLNRPMGNPSLSPYVKDDLLKFLHENGNSQKSNDRCALM